MGAILAARGRMDRYRDKQDMGGGICDHMGAAVADASARLKARLLADVAREKRRGDNSHPPTARRAEFIAWLPPFDGAPLGAGDFDFAAIDAERRTENARNFLQPFSSAKKMTPGTIGFRPKGG